MALLECLLLFTSASSTSTSVTNSKELKEVGGLYVSGTCLCLKVTAVEHLSLGGRKVEGYLELKIQTVAFF